MEAMEFEEIYEDFRPQILNYRSRRIGPDEAEDTARKVFARDKAAAIMKAAADALTEVWRADDD